MRWLCIIFIFSFLSSCTKVELGYRLAPRSTMSKLDDFFEFKSERFKKVRSQLDEDFKTNRTQVGQLVTLHVDEILKLSNRSEITAADFRDLLKSIQKTRGTLVTLFKGSFTVVITDLTADEVNSMDQLSTKKFKEHDKKLFDKEEFVEKQMDSFEKIMDFLFDSASDEQVVIYQQFLTENYNFFVAQAEYRKGFIKRFDSLAGNKPELLDYVMKYYSGDPSTRSQDQLGQLSIFNEKFYEVMDKIWNLASKKQRENLKSNLSDLKTELNKMIVN